MSSKSFFQDRGRYSTQRAGASRRLSGTFSRCAQIYISSRHPALRMDSATRAVKTPTPRSRYPYEKSRKSQRIFIRRSCPFVKSDQLSRESFHAIPPRVVFTGAYKLRAHVFIKGRFFYELSAITGRIGCKKHDWKFRSHFPEKHGIRTYYRRPRTYGIGKAFGGTFVFKKSTIDPCLQNNFIARFIGNAARNEKALLPTSFRYFGLYGRQKPLIFRPSYAANPSEFPWKVAEGKYHK